MQNCDELKRAIRFMMSGKHGTSSKTIISVMTGVEITDGFGPDIPHDVSDFERCCKLLAVLPEWRSKLHLMSERFPEWQTMIENWSKIENLLCGNKIKEANDLVRSISRETIKRACRG